MKHITIKRAEQADVDAIMQLMQEAVDTVKVSDWFLPDNRQYIERTHKRPGIYIEGFIK